jgi:hypothetical protein
VEGWKSMLESQGAKFEDEPQPAEEAREDEPENADAVEAEDKDVKKKPARAVAGGLG